MEIFSAVSNAIGIAKRLKELQEKIKDADFKHLVADLNIELAEIKMRLADVIQENVQLKQNIQELESKGERCPKCGERTWNVASSRPHPTFGHMGAIDRTYKCTSCGFSEVKFVGPGR